MTQGSPWTPSKLGNCILLSPYNFLWRSYSSNLHLVNYCITLLCLLLNSFQKVFVLLVWAACPFMWSTNDGKLQNEKTPLSVFNIEVHRIYRCWLGPFCIQHWVHMWKKGESAQEGCNQEAVVEICSQNLQIQYILPLEDSCTAYNLHVLHLFSTFSIWLQFCTKTGLSSITIPRFTPAKQTHKCMKWVV